MGAAFRNIRNRKNRERVRSSLRPFSAGLRSTQAKAGLLTRFRRDAFPTARSVARDCRDDSPEHPGRNSQQRELLQTCTAFPFNPCGRAAREPFAGAKVTFSAVFPNPKPKIRPFDPIPPTSGKAAARPRADFPAAARQGAARSPTPSGNDPPPRRPDCPPATSLHDMPASRLPTARPQPLFTICRPLASRLPARNLSSRPAGFSGLPTAAVPAFHAIRGHPPQRPGLPYKPRDHPAPCCGRPLPRNRSLLPRPEPPPPATGVLASPRPAVPGTKKRGTPQRHSPPSDNNPVPAATCRPRRSLSARPAP